MPQAMMKSSPSKWADADERSSTDTDLPTDTEACESSRNEEVSCPDCRGVMQWKVMKRGDCSNSKAIGSSCVTPASKGWSCCVCKQCYCIACLASLRKIDESKDSEDEEDEDWHVVPTKQRRQKPSEKKPNWSNQQTKSSVLVENFCQAREMDDWVRRELLAIPAQEVGSILATLSNALEANPSADLRAIIAHKRSHCALARRRLDESTSKRLQEWIANLNLTDLDRNEMYAVLNDGFDKSEIEYLMEQWNFARKVREGAYSSPIGVACSIMTNRRVNSYQTTVSSFAHWARLSRKSAEQLMHVGPKTGEAFIAKWKATRFQDLEMIEREIQKMYNEERSGKSKKYHAPPVQEKICRFRQQFSAYADEDERFENDHEVHENPAETRPPLHVPSYEYADAAPDDDEDEQVCPFDEDEDDEFGEVELAPLPAFAKRHAGEDMSISMTSNSSVRSNTSICRDSEDRPGKRVPVETHFIVVVDISGSMCEFDCKQDGLKTGAISRIDAVFNEVRQLVDLNGVRAGCDDRMSFITFSETATIHFQEQPLEKAAQLLNGMQRPKPMGRTFYAEGLRAAASCARKDSKHRPVDVVFLSDGEPSDSQDMLNTVQLDLLPTRSRRKELAVHCIGFGTGASAAAGGAAEGRGRHKREEDDKDVFAFLQQLSAVGEGHFHRASASTSSLRGAFGAVTSTITASRTVSLAKKEAKAGDESPENGEKKKKKKKESVEKPKTFELRNVIFDLDEDELGKRDIKANRIYYEFNGSNFESTSQETQVSIRRNPFTKGGMRHCYGLRDMGLRMRNQEKMVAKMSKWVEEGDVDPLTTVDIYAKQTAVAHYYARQFRHQCRKYAGIDFFLDFVPCYAYRPIQTDDEAELEGFCGEQYVTGEFVKLTSNAGFVNREEYGAHANVGAAFSHFTFEMSKGALLVADIQGVCKGHRDDGRSSKQGPNEEDKQRQWLLSDPQVLTDGASYDFGRGDLGLKGMQMFFKTHKCGWLCKKLHLKDIGEYKEPTARCHIPGSTNVLAGLHGKEGAIVKNIRIQSGVSRLLLPREAYAEWIALNIYASSKSQANHAVMLVKDRVNELIASYGVKIEVPETSKACSWNATYWRSKRVEWMEKSQGAQIVLYRGGMMQETPREDGLVVHIYVFPKGVERGRGQVHANNTERDIAVDLIRRDVLGEEPQEPLERKILVKRIHEYVRQSGGAVSCANVAKQFAKDIGTNKTQLELTGFVQNLALDFREQLECNGEQLMLPAPRATPAIVQRAVTKVASKVKSVRDLEWLDGTTWKETTYNAKYQITRIYQGKPGACFSVKKISGSAHVYAITLYFDETARRLYYGDKMKWYLSGLSDAWLSWSGRGDDTVAYEWVIVGKPPVGRVQAASTEAFPPLPGAKPTAPPSAKAAPRWVPRLTPATPPEQVPEPAESVQEEEENEQNEQPEEAETNDDNDEAQLAADIPPPPANPPQPPRVWTRFLDETDRKWWSNALDESKWFWEGDARWEKYEVPPGHPMGEGRIYFWNNVTHECFFEDTGSW